MSRNKFDDDVLLSSFTFINSIESSVSQPIKLNNDVSNTDEKVALVIMFASQNDNVEISVKYGEENIDPFKDQNPVENDVYFYIRTYNINLGQANKGLTLNISETVGVSGTLLFYIVKGHAYEVEATASAPTQGPDSIEYTVTKPRTVTYDGALTLLSADINASITPENEQMLVASGTIVDEDLNTKSVYALSALMCGLLSKHMEKAIDLFDYTETVPASGAQLHVVVLVTRENVKTPRKSVIYPGNTAYSRGSLTF